MIVLKLALRNLARRRARSLLVGSLIAFGTALFVVATSAFGTASLRLETAFTKGLSGDFAIAARADQPFSLLGPEFAILSDYQGIEPIDGAEALLGEIGAIPGVEAVTGVANAVAIMEIAGSRYPVPLLGVDPEGYLSICQGIAVGEGVDAGSLGASWVLVNDTLRARVEADLGRPLAQGEDILFLLAAGDSFTIRKGRYAGPYRYENAVEGLSQVVLADAVIVRSLAGFALGARLSESGPVDSAGPADFDELFGSSSDIAATDVGDGALEALESALRAPVVDRGEMGAGGVSFILARTAPGARDAAMREADRIVGDRRESIRVLSWREASGAAAQALSAIQSVFLAGLGFIAVAALLVISNSLATSVLERRAEIGTIRGIGGDARFVSALFASETAFLTVGASAIGIVLGAVAVAVLGCLGIRNGNPLLAALLGERLSIVFDPRAIPLYLGVAAGVSSLAWIYPVRLALRVQPVAAMDGRD